MPPVEARSEFQAFALRADARPVRPRARDARTLAALPWRRTALVSAASIAVLTFLAQERRPQPAAVAPAPRAPVALSAPAAAWHPVPDPAKLYALDAPALSGLPLALQVRRSVRGAREDTLSAGALAAPDAPHLRLVLLRTALAGEAAAPTSLFVDVVRRAAEAGVAVTRSALPAAVETKFGPVETASVELAGERSRHCMGFRGQHGEVGFRFVGWLCGTPAVPASPEGVACLVDALALAPAAADPALATAFAQAEGQRRCRALRVAAPAKRP